MSVEEFVKKVRAAYIKDDALDELNEWIVYEALMLDSNFVDLYGNLTSDEVLDEINNAWEKLEGNNDN